MRKAKHPGGRPRATLPAVTSEPKNGRWYTVPELANEWNVSRQTVRSRLKDGTIPYKKYCGVFRVYPEDLKGAIK